MYEIVNSSHINTNSKSVTLFAHGSDARFFISTRKAIFTMIQVFVSFEWILAKSSDFRQNDIYFYRAYQWGLQFVGEMVCIMSHSMFNHILLKLLPWKLSSPFAFFGICIYRWVVNGASVVKIWECALVCARDWIAGLLNISFGLSLIDPSVSTEVFLRDTLVWVKETSRDLTYNRVSF